MEPEVSKFTVKRKAFEITREVETVSQRSIVADCGKIDLTIDRYRYKTASPHGLWKGGVLSYDDPSAPVCENDWEIECRFF
ncbi:hypothetical protein GZ77_06265 [Endozoicomonas montiporae]|uniref:Uncharacterized protein n=3 Tax=Endozoicomonas montiporae TaxID=1027273 RepID=A0A081NC91_9GAMM|nr:hypothetical protein EZMO1_2297 [Endozoicomonas montiporae CL-33]KEQ16064.1 hypothetical protein GZ77_06265 [Endozoicomonas montiporae]